MFLELPGFKAKDNTNTATIKPNTSSTQAKAPVQSNNIVKYSKDAVNPAKEDIFHYKRHSLSELSSLPKEKEEDVKKVVSKLKIKDKEQIQLLKEVSLMMQGTQSLGNVLKIQNGKLLKSFLENKYWTTNFTMNAILRASASQTANNVI